MEQGGGYEGGKRVIRRVGVIYEERCARSRACKRSVERERVHCVWWVDDVTWRTRTVLEDRVGASGALRALRLIPWVLPLSPACPRRPGWTLSCALAHLPWVVPSRDA